MDPAGQARWTLGRLYGRLCEWAYEVYDTLEHPALGQSPRDAFTAGLVQGGRRVHRLIAYDDDFRLLTLPTTHKGTAKVVPRLGVKINYLCYWSDAFLDAEVEATQVPVRYDPLDAGTAYAFVKGRWVRCISEHYARFAGRSEREVMQATVELRRRNQCHGQRFAVTARKLADFLASVEAEEVLLEQRLQDAEAKDVLEIMAGASKHWNGKAIACPRKRFKRFPTAWPWTTWRRVVLITPPPKYGTTALLIPPIPARCWASAFRWL